MIDLKLRDKKDSELYKRCDEILHYVWDPIGVQDIPLARDEYYGYLPQVFKLLKSGADKIKISEYLDRTEEIDIGLSSNLSKNLEVAKLLINWRNAIYEEN